MNKGIIMTIGIDVSKQKSTTAARDPGGEVALLPFIAEPTARDLQELISTFRQLGLS